MKKMRSFAVLLLTFALAFSMLPAMNGSLYTHAASPYWKNLKTVPGGVGAATQIKWKKLSKKQQKKIGGITVFRDGKPIKNLKKSAKSFSDSMIQDGTKYTYQLKTYKKSTKKVRKYWNKVTKEWQKKKIKGARTKKVKETIYKYKNASPKMTVVTESYDYEENADAPSDTENNPSDGEDVPSADENTGTGDGMIEPPDLVEDTEPENTPQKENPAEKYSYTVTPILPQLNGFFYVETENPDPKSFRFLDKDSKYSTAEDGSAVITPNLYRYADIEYENADIYRVNGGYIFSSISTDGGEVILQTNDGSYSDYNHAKWVDSEAKLKLPQLQDTADYLISTYAKGGSFFDKMDSVQDGFKSICLYSGSYIRGQITKPNDYWFVATAGHMDQSFYIYSPYERENDRSLFVSYLYPFIADSWGFPSVMATVSERLDSRSSYKWSDTSHYLIDVTYGGETRSFGGAGQGEGKAVNEVLKYFTVGKNSSQFTLEGLYSLLKKYSEVVVDDDIPREDSLTWEMIGDTVGDGSWVRISDCHSKSNNKWLLGESVYAYMFKNRDRDYYYGSEWGVGYSNYLDGDLLYARDSWVDGRYVDDRCCFAQGEKYEDHPTSSIILKDVLFPNITYNYTYHSEDDIDYYDIKITETKRTVKFVYEDGVWTASGDIYDLEPDKINASSSDIRELVEKGLIDEKYLDVITLTQDEVDSMDLDCNTDSIPGSGYAFDGQTPPGTRF